MNLYVNITGGRRYGFNECQLVQLCISPNIPISWSAWYAILKTDKKTLIHEIIADLETTEVKEEKKISSQKKRGNKSMTSNNKRKVKRKNTRAI